MERGLLSAWHVDEGAPLSVGDELVDIETEKIANSVEATHSGILRRRIGTVGEAYPCGALIGVIAEATVAEEEITAFVAEHAATSRPVSVEASGPTPQMIDVNGHSLRYLTQGAGGVPVLLIHGLAGDLNNWLFVQPALSGRRVCYAVDLPGHGGSSKDLSGIHNLVDVGDLLLAFLDRLALDRVHLVAHSMGAAVALDLARRRGHRLASLTLLSPAGLGVSSNSEFIAGLMAAGNRREMAAVLKMLLADEVQVSRDLVNDMLKYKRLDGAEAALRKFCEFLSQENRSTAQALAGVATPVQVIWGAQDRILRPLTAAELPSNVRLTVLESTGHMPHLEKSSRVVEAIENWGPSG